jgi:hypothetical protein
MPIQCPDCRSQHLYVKDPEDQYNIFEFEMEEGKIVSSDNSPASISMEVTEDTEIFCDRCAWND